MRYILIWTTEETGEKRKYFGDGTFPFIDNRCSNTNCYLTTNKTFLGDYTNFDAIVFNTKYMRDWRNKKLPARRSVTQKYIFHSTITSDDAPVCNVITDGYFNWTCTYKMDSDIFNPMVEVLDLEGNYVAPKSSVDWETSSDTLLDTTIRISHNKTKAMAWIVDRCDTRNDRLAFARKLQKALKEMSLDFDIYGCGFLDCPKDNCMKVIRDYYFYYAAEESDAMDYITKEVLRAFHTLTVPVVRGGADYKKFLPARSYIDSKSTSMDSLVAWIDHAIRDPLTYKHFHLWRKYYRVRAVNPFQGLCRICMAVNDKAFNRHSVKNNFRMWWNNGPLFERCLPKSAESLSHVLSYANKTVW
ncbi:alpha-(1,3)-fucosyltransferase C-like [Aricia agestis]|uniref:alpha-(1,3)-fucosyltransferase C-like n=1 Tax=Aricia agestis TaxID=91739 RepID=UPI001C209D5A|nr:alpha-(1,3)-fucosyltransferase C-like [Aricia agestis]